MESCLELMQEKVSYDPKERVKRNIEQGKGFRLMDNVGGKGKGGDFEFA
jgi:hypothetical protein